MINLDDQESILKLQKGDKVIKSIDALPDQLLQSFNESLALQIPADYKKVKNVVICGMGGSQWPARIVLNLFKEELKVPYLINSDYTLPGFVNQDTLVVLSSYSGTTEESIVCGKKAQELGAKLIGITSGGEIEKFLKQLNLPVYVFNPTNNPSQQPRIGFGYGVGGHLGLLINLGLVNYDQSSIKSAIQTLKDLTKNFSLDTPLKNNPAKQLAEKLFNFFPYYIVSEFLVGIGNAIQNQTNENAKTIASYREIPELNHHLMEGLKNPRQHPEMAKFVFFNSSLYSESIKKRFKITKEVVEKNNTGTIWHELSGKNKIEQAFELMALGNYMTMYLSILYGEDASLIPYVDYFKKKLKE